MIPSGVVARSTVPRPRPGDRSDRIAGGVRRMRRRCRPEQVGLGGRCVVASTTPLSTFLRGRWPRSRLEGTHSVEGGFPGGITRLRATADGCGDAAGGAAVARAADGKPSTRSPADVPVSLALTRTRSGSARGPGPGEQRPGCRRRGRAGQRGEPTGVLREESCWRSASYIEISAAGTSKRCARACEWRRLARVCVHDKDGWIARSFLDLGV
jgi:hypothetical protein